MFVSKIELVSGANNDQLFISVEEYSNITTLYRMCDAQPVQLIVAHECKWAKKYQDNYDDVTESVTITNYQPSVSADGQTLTVINQHT